jgi:uncharacterized protein
MRKLFHKLLPPHETVKSQRWLKPFGSWLQHPNRWHLHRRSVAGGVAIGLPLLAVSLAIIGYFAVRVAWG